MKRYTGFLILLMTAIGACAPLSKSQLKISQNYFETIANHPRHYKELNLLVAQLTLEHNTLKSALEETDALRIAAVIQSIHEYETTIILPDSIAKYTRTIDTYIQQYYSLIPNGFDMYKALKGTTATVGGFFGLGAVAGLLPVKEINQMNPTKKGKIRRHIRISNDEVLQAFRPLKTHIENHILVQLDELSSESIKNFERLFSTIDNATLPMTYYTTYNRLLTSYYERLLRTRHIAKQLTSALENTMVVNDELSKHFEERATLDLETINLNALIYDTQRIHYLLSKLESEHLN